jgi:SAM-dependent methyltransferase
MSFADHFSKQSSDYAKYRPGYPQALFDWLKTLTLTHELAWDVGTGNGQAAVELAKFFGIVVATDPSAAQIKNAVAHANVSYRVQAAEQSDLADRSVDLVTVAQALHWFDFERFYPEVKRVMKSTGVFAAWTYTLNQVTPEIDAVVRHYYQDIVGPYWPPERTFIDECYRTIPMPLQEINAPPIRMETQWSLSDYIGYLHTWSATQRYQQTHLKNPVAEIVASLTSAWGEPTIRTVIWPIYMRVGRFPAPL